MNKLTAPLLLIMAVLLTGCPSDQYIVELTPRDAALERVLTFYRQDGTTTNGIPKYLEFPTDRLHAISNKYSPNSIRTEGKRHTAKGAFNGAMPNDVGGAGSWTNIITTLGSAAFYVERFRGNDDLLASSTRRTKAADQLVDLLVGWSQQEFGNESGFSRLRQFLDGDLRHDLKNLTLHHWLTTVTSDSAPQAAEELFLRLGQYLAERNYFHISELPQLYSAFENNDHDKVPEWIRQFVGRKMGRSATDPLPPSFAIFTSVTVLQTSWTNFVTKTDFYQKRMERWRTESKMKPDLVQPSPADAVDELFATLIDFRLFGGTDQLIVKLNLPVAPVRSNGKWNETSRHVSWESNLEQDPESPRLPTLCYATWSIANTAAQQAHFGRVTLEGEGLLAYCLWRAAAPPKHATEWEAFLSGLNPDSSLQEKIDAFRFSDETTPNGTVPNDEGRLASESPRRLLKSALDGKLTPRSK